MLAAEELKFAESKLKPVLTSLNGVLKGKPDIVQKLLIAFLSQGHLLLEGLPGLGKTELVKGFAKLVNLGFNRIQFTPDLMPSDITGTLIMQEKDGARHMEFQKGPIFTNVLLADEINRASPKTQAALLEAMAERQVSVLGRHHVLEGPFIVLATQNPLEMEGTYPLPEAQLDRFLFKLEMKEVSADVLEQILIERSGTKENTLTTLLSVDDCRRLIQMVKNIYLPKEVARYVARLVANTSPLLEKPIEKVKNYLHFGCSPRAAIGITMAAKALALLQGRPSVGFEDVKFVACDVLAHRMLLNYQAGLDRVRGRDIAQVVLEQTGELQNDFLSKV